MSDFSSELEQRRQIVERFLNEQFLDEKPQKVIFDAMRYRTELLRRLEQVPGAWQNVFYSQQKNVSTLAARLDAMSPLKVLSRGYSVTVHEDGHVVRNAKELLEGENIRIRFCSGTVNAIVNEIVEE